MKRVVFSVVLALVGCIAFGQTKAVREAKKLADSKKFTEAEQLINEALTNPETKDVADTWNIAGYIQYKINDENNKNAYLNQSFDTVQFYNSIYKMFEYYNKCDELEQIPDEKGRVKIKYRKDNAPKLRIDRPNLINGGVFYFNSGKDAEAYKFFSLYIESANYPMLQSENLVETDSLLSTIAYYASLAATKIAQSTEDSIKAAESYQDVLRYVDLAVNDEENGRYAMEFKCAAYKALNDTVKWVSALQEGIKAYPDHDYFFGNLIDYYSNNDKYEEALIYVNDVVARNSNSAFYQYVKGYILQNMKEYDQAISAYEKATELDPAYVDAYSNLGLCYCQQAIDFGESTVSDMTDPKYQEEQNQIKAYYEKARPYYEKVRELAPDRRDLWLNGLYTVYYSLNMGDEFREIEKLMQE